MRKLGAQSLTLVLSALLLSGCSSTGDKSFSMSSLNPMTYFAKSDSDSPVPRPSEQMAPTVTLPEAASVASTGDAPGGTAPASPYPTTPDYQSRPQVSTPSAFPPYMAPQTASTSPTAPVTPQQGLYDPNGGLTTATANAAVGSPYTPPAAATSPSYPTNPSGFANTPAPNGYQTPSGAQYALGGQYDIQKSPVTAEPTAPYANNAANAVQPTSTFPGPTTSAAPEPYTTVTTPAYPSGLAAQPAPTARRDLGGVATRPEAPAAPSAAMPNAPGNYTPGQTDYQPGQTDYNPPGVPPYTPPTTDYQVPTSNSGTQFAPGSTSRYPSTATPASYNAIGSLY